MINSLEQRLRRYLHRGEAARLRAALRPEYKVTRLRKLRDMFWAHVATRRVISMAALLISPTI
jgi:hypothetical protein